MTASLDGVETSARGVRAPREIVNAEKNLFFSVNDLTFCRHLRRLEVHLFDFACATYTNKHWQRISARLLKYDQEILTFLKVPGLPSHNNLAERMIRPNVIYRNRSFGNRSDSGAEAHGTIMSLMQTLRLQGKNVTENFRQAFLRHRQGFSAPCLSLRTR